MPKYLISLIWIVVFISNTSGSEKATTSRYCENYTSAKIQNKQSFGDHFKYMEFLKPSNWKELESQDVKSSERRIPLLEDLSIPYYLTPSLYTSTITPWFKYGFDIWLGQINQAQFESLLLHFKKNHFYNPQLQYQENTIYHLMDFLPTSLQALYPFSHWTNCYNFVASYIDATSSDVRLLSAHDALVNRLTDTKLFYEVLPGETLQTGDLIVSLVDNQYVSATPNNPDFQGLPPKFIIDHVEIYIDRTTVLSANPNGFQLGGVMNAHYFTPSGQKTLLPVSPFFETGVFQNSLNNSYRVFRRIISETQMNPLKLKPGYLFDEFSWYTIRYKTDSIGRAKVNIENNYDCRKN